jgi:hypothetical protein
MLTTLSGSGPEDSTRSILYAFICSTFRILSTTHIMHSVLMRFDFNLLHACWKPLENNTRTIVMIFQWFTTRVVQLMVVFLGFHPTQYMWFVLLKRRDKPPILHRIEIQRAAITRTNRINFADIKIGVSRFVSMYCLQCLSLALLHKYRFSNTQVVFRTTVCNKHKDVHNKCKL